MDQRALPAAAAGTVDRVDKSLVHAVVDRPWTGCRISDVSSY